ncbi:MAG: radical SAM protein [Candidatus Aenigmarchaeota archaeon]|nr:radical SAM protein [Candidatus Aenigmarchaeota archaeon]
MFWQKERNGVRDFITPREEFLPKGKLDFSQTRENRDNRLFALNFGRVTAMNVEKIEKSHLFHFYPNSNSLFVGSAGCNFKSPFCSEYELQNKNLHENPLDVKYTYQTPEQIVDAAKKRNTKIITLNYTEPFIFIEFAFKVARNAQRENVKTTIVTNGFTTDEPIKKIGKVIDGVTIKLTGSLNKSLYEKYMSVKEVGSIFAALKQFKKQRVFIEITNTIVPQIGDSLEECKILASWISHELGAETPFHLMQFHPSPQLPDLPVTPVSTLEHFAEECRRDGLRYVYIHSTPPHQEESTFCYNCREIAVERKNLSVKKSTVTDGRCANCSVRLNILSE